MACSQKQLLRIMAVLSCFGAVVPLEQRQSVVIELGEATGKIRPLLGVNAGPLIIKGGSERDLTKAFVRTGVRAVRTHDFYGPMDMAVIYPDPFADPRSSGSYRFAESDRVFRSILDAGFEPYLRIGDSWNIDPAHGSIRRRAPANPDNWILAATEVVRHYSGMAGPKMRFVEIWNEPDHRKFWDASPPEFADLFCRTVVAIKKEFPRLKVGGPAFTQMAVGTEGGRRRLASFLQTVSSRKVPLDFLSWHCYANEPERFREVARGFRSALDEAGLRNVPVHVTEYNTDERVLPRGLHPVELRAGSVGGAVVTAMWIVLQEENVEEACFYRGSDVAMDQPMFYGLLRADGTPKGTGLAFNFWSRMARCSQRLQVRCTGEDKDTFFALAGRATDGTVLLLLTNVSPEHVTWRISNAAALAPGGITVEQISGRPAEVQAFKVPDGRALVPPYTAQLVTLSPRR